MADIQRPLRRSRTNRHGPAPSVDAPTAPESGGTTVPLS